MKNNKNILIVLCVLVGILIIVVLSTKTNKTEIQKQDINPATIIPSNPIDENTIKVSTPTPNIDLQANCEVQSQKLIKSEESRNNYTMTFKAVSHFNVSLNKCFVNLTGEVKDKEDYLTSMGIWDTEQGKVVLACNITGYKTLTKQCFIPMNSSDTGMPINLTEQEADIKINNYMNN